MSSIAGKPQSASPAGTSAEMFSSPAKRSLVLCLLLVAATLLLYNSVARHPFVNFDDDRYVVNNLHIQNGLHWDTLHWAFTTTAQANWHPLTWLSHALDCQLFHLNPAGHHYTNVLLHAVNVALLFLLLQWTTGSTWRSLMVAALFALHPVNVESVAWISERKNLLSMLFFLLALWSYGWYARKPGVGRYLLLAALFGLGLMAKPQIITLPFVLLLWDYWPLRRMFPPRPQDLSLEKTPAGAPQPFSWLVLEKIPLLLISAASAIVTVKAQRAGGAVRTITEYSFAVRLQNAAVSYARYLVNAFWPSRLAPLYPHPGNSLTSFQVATATLLVLSITALVLAGRRWRYLPVGWFWFLGTLVPMIGLVQVGEAAMADRYAYLSFLGLFLIVCWGAADWSKRRQISARWLALPALAALLGLAVTARRQLNYWSDNITLWSHTLQVTRENFVAQDNLGGALLVAGRIDEAMPHFRSAAQINPRDPLANFNIAANLQTQGKLQQAVELYGIVLSMTSDVMLRADAYSNLGAADRAIGDRHAAKANYESALRLSPENVHAWTGLGLLALKAGDSLQATADFTQSTQLDPTALNYLLLAHALEQSGRPADAVAARQAAQQLSSDLTGAQQEAEKMLAE